MCSSIAKSALLFLILLFLIFFLIQLHICQFSIIQKTFIIHRTCSGPQFLLISLPSKPKFLVKAITVLLIQEVWILDEILSDHFPSDHQIYLVHIVSCFSFYSISLKLHFLSSPHDCF